MFLINNLMNYRDKLEKDRQLLIIERNASPDGNLFIRKQSDGSFKLYIRRKGPRASQEIYVNKNLVPEAKRIARKMYVSCRIQDLTKQIGALDHVISSFGDESSAEMLLCKNSWLQKLLPPTKMNDRMQSWKNSEYERSFDYPENLKFNTVVPGLKVRSKSEAAIVGLLEKYGIPYHYDVVLHLNGQRIVVDFVCMNIQTEEIWYWDHRGMMDDSAYIEKTIYCDRAFLRAGICPGRNMIVTAETRNQPFDPLEADALIQLYLM